MLAADYRVSGCRVSIFCSIADSRDATPNISDMGIALGSAVKTASMLNVDNRIMYRIGTAARAMKMVDWDFVMGIPLSATGKNIFFDR